METNRNNDINTTNIEEPKGFLHGGWVYFIFLFIVVGVIVGLSYLAKLLF